MRMIPTSKKNAMVCEVKAARQDGIGEAGCPGGKMGWADERIGE